MIAGSWGDATVSFVGLRLVVFCAALSCGAIATQPAPPIVDAGASSDPRITVLASAHARYIVVDASNVYWIGGPDDETVNRCAKTGCTAPTVLAASPRSMGPLAVGGANLYWGGYRANDAWASARIMACATTGCTNAPFELASAQSPATAIAADGHDVYWATAESVMRCAGTGCGGAPITIVSSPLQHPESVAVDATNVYWTVDTGDVLTCPKSGCAGAPVTLASGQSGPSSIVVDAVNVYWTTSRAIMACPKSGCAGAPSSSSRAPASMASRRTERACIGSRGWMAD